jgi:hypothetical protein
VADADPLAARVGQIRRRLDMANYSDSRWLLAAVERVLALAGEFDTEDGTTPEDAQILGRPVSRGDRIREAITRELLGKGEGDG